MHMRILYLFQAAVLSYACQDAVPIPALDRRARNYKADGVIEPFVNDFILTDRWYSVFDLEQYLMPDSTKMPEYFTCGGSEPIYIEGNHPDVAALTETPVDASACVRNTFDDCDAKYQIKVRKCFGRIEYYFVGTRQFASYCLDPPNIQAAEGNFPTAPTDVDLGTVTVVPTLEFDEGPVEVYTPYLMFRCKFNSVDVYFYTVYWFIDEKLHTKLGPTKIPSELILNEKDFIVDKRPTIPLGFTLKCGVRVSWSPVGISTDIVSSEGYFAGIKVLNPVIHMDKAETVSVRLKMNIPLGCRYTKGTEDAYCKLSLHFVKANSDICENSGILESVNNYNHRVCGQYLEALSVDKTWDKDKEHIFNITTKFETYDDSSHLVLQLVTAEDYGHRWWQNYQLENVQVIVSLDNNFKNRVCYSRVDPHMQTADGYHYENQEEGEYLLYRHKDYPIEVQEKYKRCNNNHALCTCDVRIRAGADVFAVSLCTNKKFVEFLSCREGGILKVVNRTEKHYTVYTPIGTIIDINMHGFGTYDGFMNVDITMSPKDLGRIEGLCGNMDNNYLNDLVGRDGTKYAVHPLSLHIYSRFHLEFTRSWRLTASENLFTNTYQRLSKWEVSNALFCICEQPANDSNQPTKAICSPTQYLDCHFSNADSTRRKCLINRRRKRSIEHKKGREVERLMIFTSNAANSHKTPELKSLEKNITEEEALNTCTKMIQESVVVSQLPESIKGDNPQAVVEQCVFDVTAGNDLSLANVHVDAINSVAQNSLKLNPVFTANNTERVEYFVKNSCPGNCTGRGECSDQGLCICDSYFHGSDCGIDEREPVVITDMEGGGLCNLTDGDGCECFNIRTTVLLPMFSCNITGQRFFTDGTTENITSTIANGDYENLYSGLCCVPEGRTERSLFDKIVFSARYDIALSNDGQNFGSPESIHVYASECQDAVLQESNGNVEIVLKENYCFIYGMCVAQSSESSDDICLVCDSRTNVYNWTLTDCRQKVVENSNSNISVILGATFGSITTVALICVAYLVWHFKLKTAYKKQKSVAASQDFTNTEASASDRRMF